MTSLNRTASAAPSANGSPPSVSSPRTTYGRWAWARFRASCDQSTPITRWPASSGAAVAAAVPSPQPMSRTVAVREVAGPSAAARIRAWRRLRASPDATGTAGFS